jgi:hypothetical protein
MLVSAMGGTITLSDRESGGTRARVALPAVRRRGRSLPVLRGEPEEVRA